MIFQIGDHSGIYCLDDIGPARAFYVDAEHTLIDAGLRAGAEGGKLSGAGRGGNVIFYIEPPDAEKIKRALLDACATSVVVTQVGSEA